MGGWLASDGDDIATPAGGRGGRGISDIFPDGDDSKRDRGRAGDTTGAGCCWRQATGKHRDTLAPYTQIASSPHGPFHCPIDNSVPEISILSLRLPRLLPCTASRGCTYRLLSPAIRAGRIVSCTTFNPKWTESVDTKSPIAI